MPLTDWLQLRDRPSLVVGAGGLGGASAVQLARLGARVLLVDVDPENLESVRRATRAAGAELETVAADLRDPRTCREIVELALRQLGGLDIFLHAVGTNVRKPILELDDEAWAGML